MKYCLLQNYLTIHFKSKIYLESQLTCTWVITKSTPINIEETKIDVILNKNYFTYLYIPETMYFGIGNRNCEKGNWKFWDILLLLEFFPIVYCHRHDNNNKTEMLIHSSIHLTSYFSLSFHICTTYIYNFSGKWTVRITLWHF